MTNIFWSSVSYKVLAATADGVLADHSLSGSSRLAREEISVLQQLYNGTSKVYNFADWLWYIRFYVEFYPAIVQFINRKEQEDGGEKPAVLHLGIGTARLWDHVGKNDGVEYVGIDLSYGMLSQAQKVVERHPELAGKLKLFQGNAVELVGDEPGHTGSTTGTTHIPIILTGEDRAGFKTAKVPAHSVKHIESTFMFCVLPNNLQRAALMQLIKALPKTSGHAYITEMVAATQLRALIPQLILGPIVVRPLYNAGFDRKTLRVLSDLTPADIGTNLRINARFLDDKHTYLFIDFETVENPAEPIDNAVPFVSAAELRAEIERNAPSVHVLDVRQDWELDNGTVQSTFDEVHFNHIPVDEILDVFTAKSHSDFSTDPDALARLEERLPKTGSDGGSICYTVNCRTDKRSWWSAFFLKQAGWNVRVLESGMDAWSREVDNNVHTYHFVSSALAAAFRDIASGCLSSLKFWPTSEKQD